MNMFELLLNRPTATKREIENAFDGNLCRCTGYRPILTGMKSFASDWNDEDERQRMRCKTDTSVNSQVLGKCMIQFPEEAKTLTTRPRSFEGSRQTWYAPTSLQDLVEIFERYAVEECHFVFSNTSYGIYAEELLAARCLIDIRSIPGIASPPTIEAGFLEWGAGVTYGTFIEFMDRSCLPPRAVGTPRFSALGYMAKRTAGRIVRNTATIGGNSMLVFKHMVEGRGEPFISDLFTALVALDAAVTYLDLRPGCGRLGIHIYTGRASRAGQAGSNPGVENDPSPLLAKSGGSE